LQVVVVAVEQVIHLLVVLVVQVDIELQHQPLP
jgi:hypothetical protein